MLLLCQLLIGKLVLLDRGKLLLRLKFVDTFQRCVSLLIIRQLGIVGLIENRPQQVRLLGRVHCLEHMIRNYGLLVVVAADGVRFRGQI